MYTNSISKKCSVIGAVATLAVLMSGQPALGMGDSCQAPDVMVTIELLTDDYGGETTWQLVERGFGVVASGGPYSNATLYQIDVPVCSTSCYDFTIYDSYGDGICCAYGIGYYNIYFDGKLICTGGEFLTSETCAGMGSNCVEPEPGLIEQPPNQVNGLFSDLNCGNCASGIQVIAENFRVAETTTINMVRMYGGSFPDNLPPVDDFVVTFHNEEGMSYPGTIINSQTPSATQTSTGVVLFGVNEYEVDLAIDDVELAPGDYWVVIYNNTPNSDSFFWETGDLDPVNGLPGSAWATTDPAGGPPAWNVDVATNLAVTLIGSSAPDCPADITGPGGDGVPDGTVDTNDLLFVFANWGPGGGNGPADVSGPGGDGIPDGTVDTNDLLFIFANWGDCQL